MCGLIPPPGGRRDLTNISLGGCHLDLKSFYLFQSKICEFTSAIPDLAFRIQPYLFQTNPVWITSHVILNRNCFNKFSNSVFSLFHCFAENGIFWYGLTENHLISVQKRQIKIYSICRA